MDHVIQKALYLIVISLGIAFIFNFLFFEKVIGISVFIIASILVGAVYLLGQNQRVNFRKTWWIISLVVFFAFMPSIRASEFLTFLNLCATLGLLMLLANELTGIPAILMRLRDYFILMTLVPLRMMGRAVSSITLIGQLRSSVKHRDVWVRVIKGVVIALPLLIIFGALFSQADLVFSRFISSFVDINLSERTIQYLVLLLIAFAASLSYISYIFLPKSVETKLISNISNSETEESKGIEVMVTLGLISSLFLVFIFFQITYLFGGEANIIKAGFTYAEYARRGFFELLAVAVLSLFVLLVSEKYTGYESKKDMRFLIPAIMLIAEVGVVMVSAFKRLTLYIEAYGMTELRFYVAGFIMLLSALFILLSIKFIKSWQEQFFAFGTLLLVSTFVILVNFVNPDAFIARSNVEQYVRTGKIDIAYLGRLSADAVQWKIEMYGKLKREEREIMRELLVQQKNRLEKMNTDWQSANLSRSRAWKLLEKFAE